MPEGRRADNGERRLSGPICLAAATQLLFGWSVPVGAAEAAVYPACQDGYQRQGTFHDYTLNRTWIVMVKCGHPEIPRLATASDRGPVLSFHLAGSPIDRLVVEPGSQVRLWRDDGRVRLDLAGVALNGGAAGAVVRVRLAPSGKVLRGVVRGPGMVELDGAGEVSGFRQEGQ
jgi:hypothetical protein